MIVLMPQSALEVLSRLNISYPMIFKIRNSAIDKETFGGVLEFSAAEGIVYLPSWMFRQLGLTTGVQVEVSSTSVPLGIFTKIQPQSPAFLDISDPRAVYRFVLILKKIGNVHKELCNVDQR
jgi:ubiquitin fusion degradation protein 1